ncbi:MAG: hypothetical protein ACE5FT_04565 [Candidatus Nanoarchaeia archaeon]
MDNQLRDTLNSRTRKFLESDPRFEDYLDYLESPECEWYKGLSHEEKAQFWNTYRREKLPLSNRIGVTSLGRFKPYFLNQIASRSCESLEFCIDRNVPEILYLRTKNGRDHSSYDNPKIELPHGLANQVVDSYVIHAWSVNWHHAEKREVKHMLPAVIYGSDNNAIAEVGAWAVIPTAGISVADPLDQSSSVWVMRKQNRDELQAIYSRNERLNNKKH